MNNTELLELYKELLKDFKRKNYLYICYTINYSIPNKDKREIFKQHFVTQIPSKTQYTELYKERLFNKKIFVAKDEGWFLFPNHKERNRESLFKSKAFKLRIKLLELIIENLENNLHITI